MIEEHLTIRVERRFLASRKLRPGPMWYGIIIGFPVKEIDLLGAARVSDRYWNVVMPRRKLRYEGTSLSQDYHRFARRMV